MKKGRETGKWVNERDREGGRQREGEKTNRVTEKLGQEGKRMQT